jgi:hypothetical protein
MCPQCGSFDLRTLVSPELGRDLETGYSDEESRYECLACGEVAEADEILEALRRAPERRLPARAHEEQQNVGPIARPVVVVVSKQIQEVA